MKDTKELGDKALVKKTNVLGRSTKRKPSEEEEEWELLGRQKESALASVVTLSELMPAVVAEAATARDLHHHAKGFYEEVDTNAHRTVRHLIAGMPNLGTPVLSSSGWMESF